jgi:hypothetical protein
MEHAVAMDFEELSGSIGTKTKAQVQARRSPPYPVFVNDRVREPGPDAPEETFGKLRVVNHQAAIVPVRRRIRRDGPLVPQRPRGLYQIQAFLLPQDILEDETGSPTPVQHFVPDEPGSRRRTGKA